MDGGTVNASTPIVVEELANVGAEIHHERDPLTLTDTTFTFVTEGIESALEQARHPPAARTFSSAAALGCSTLPTLA
jgi:hypothetical protein